MAKRRNREEISELLLAAAGGRADPARRLWSAVYDELRVVARRQLGREVPGGTLTTTVLVHEAYLRLVDDERVSSRGRAYFFAAAAQAMRRILVDHARQRQSLKRGGGERPLTLKTGDAEVDGFATDILDLHRALEQLEELNPRQSRVVECRFFGGLGVEETAAALDASPRTIKSDWALARAWLYRALGTRDGE